MSPRLPNAAGYTPQTPRLDRTTGDALSDRRDLPYKWSPSWSADGHTQRRRAPVSGEGNKDTPQNRAEKPRRETGGTNGMGRGRRAVSTRTGRATMSRTILRRRQQMKKASLFASAATATVLGLAAVPAFAQGGGPFADVPTDHWAYQSVDRLQREGVVI